MASSLPVDAPDGTAPLPMIPFSKITSASQVGLPLSLLSGDQLFF